LIGDATVQARKQPTQYVWLLAVRDSEAAGVRTDEILAAQHAVMWTEGSGRCLISLRILMHMKMDVARNQRLAMVQLRYAPDLGLLRASVTVSTSS
jgi:hypothetical protein